MSLTGRMLPTLAALLALGFFVLLVIDRPRFTALWLRLLSRATSALALVLCFGVLGGALLNDQYAFYVSWGDLLGHDGKEVGAHKGGVALAAVKANAPGPGFSDLPAPKTYPKLPSPSSQIQKYTVSGPMSGFHTQILVRLPKGYDPKKKYPVLVALHGFPGGPRLFQQIPQIFHGFDRAIQQHQLADPIIVMPQIDDPVTLDTECVNAPGGPQAESWLAHDVPEWVVQHFSVERSRTAWATWGFSYGAWCAAMLGVKHPDIFGAAIVMQGYFRPDFDPGYVPFKPGSALYGEYDLVALEKRHPVPVAMWILASKQDVLSYPTTRAFVQAVKAPTAVDSNLLQTGGHRLAVWAPHIQETMAWLGNVMPGFSPSR